MSVKQLDVQQQLDQVKQPLPVIYPSSAVLVQSEVVSEKDSFILSTVVAFDGRIVRVRDWSGKNEQNVSWDRIRLIDLAKFKRDVANGTTGLGFSAGDPVLALWRENKMVPFQQQYRTGLYFPPTKLTTDKVDAEGQCCVVYDRSFQMTNDLWTLRNSCGNVPCTVSFPSVVLPVALANVPVDSRMMSDALDYMVEYTKVWEEARAQEKGRLIAQATQSGAGRELQDLWRGAIVTSARAALEDEPVESIAKRKASEQKQKLFSTTSQIMQRFPNLAPSTPFSREPVHLVRGGDMSPGVFETIYSEIRNAFAQVFIPRDKRLQDLYQSSLAECLALKQPLVAAIPDWMRLQPDSRANPAVRLWCEQQLPLRLRNAPAKGLFETAESMVAGIPVNTHSQRFSSLCHVRSTVPATDKGVLKHTSSFTQHVAFCGRLSAEMRHKAKEELARQVPNYTWTSVGDFLQSPEETQASKRNPVYVPYAHPLVPLPSLTTLVACGPGTKRSSDETGILFNQPADQAFLPIDVANQLKPLPLPGATTEPTTDSRLVVKKKAQEELISSRIGFRSADGKAVQFKYSSTAGSAVAAPFVTIF